MTKANLFQISCWTGLAGILATAAGFAGLTDRNLALAGQFVFLLSGLVTLVTHTADDHTQALWLAGTSTAYAGLVAGIILVPFAEGLYDGITGNENSPASTVELGTLMAVAAFYAGLFWKRIRGGAV